MSLSFLFLPLASEARNIERVRVSVDNSSVQGDDHSSEPSINSDGRYVAFESDAANLVTGDTNGYSDVFVSYTVSDTSPPLGGGGDSGGGCFISTCVLE